MEKSRDIDIVKNMKTVDWLKSELLGNLAGLHKILVNNEESTRDDLEDALANIILDAYILGKRLGLDFEGIDRTMKENIRLNLIKEHKIEKWYGDLSQLLNYLVER